MNISEQPLDDKFLRKAPVYGVDDSAKQHSEKPHNVMIAELMNELRVERKRSARWKEMFRILYWINEGMKNELRKLL